MNLTQSYRVAHHAQTDNPGKMKPKCLRHPSQSGHFLPCSPCHLFLKDFCVLEIFTKLESVLSHLGLFCGHFQWQACQVWEFVGIPKSRAISLRASSSSCSHSHYRAMLSLSNGNPACQNAVSILRLDSHWSGLGCGVLLTSSSGLPVQCRVVFHSLESTPAPANIKVLAVRFGFFKAPIGSTVRAVRFRKRFGSRFIAVPLKLPLVSRFLLACHSVEPEEQSCVAFFCCASVRFAVRAIRIAVCCGSAGGGSVPAARFGSTGFLKYST